MPFAQTLPLTLGLIIASFLVSSILVVPFINLLYKLRLLRQKEGKGAKKQSLFDKLHDKKAGTPIGGGILVLTIVAVIFAIVFPLASNFGVFIQSAYDLRGELIVIFFTFLSFGVLGLMDDLVKIFGKGEVGAMGLWIGMKRTHKFVLQWALAFITAYLIYAKLGIHILNIPMADRVLDLGWGYVPFAAFVIVAFANAFNITDGLDGLATGLLLICLMAFGTIAAGNLDTPLSIFISIWSGSLIAFLYFNIWPARIWLGDAGALSFGATLAVIGLLTGSIIALVVIGAIFVVELASSAVQIYGWRVLKRPILPLAPLHNTFLVKGWEEPKIVMRAWLTGIIFAIFGLWLATI